MANGPKRAFRRAQLQSARMSAFGNQRVARAALANAAMPNVFDPLAYWRRFGRGGGGGGGGGSRSVGSSVIPVPPDPPVPPPPPPPPPPLDPLAIYDDEMQGPTLNPLWTYFREDLILVMEFTGGMLHIGGAGSALANFWFNEFIGYLAGPIITGDFIMRARIQPRNFDGDGPPPLTNYRLGGISMHDPAQPPQNYAHLAGGAMAPDVGAIPVIESKNNQNDVSNYTQAPWPFDVFSEYALQRVGQIVTFATKLDADVDYTVHRIVDRTVDGPAFPAAMHAALHSYSDQLVSDVSILVDWVRFSTPGFNGGLILPTS